MVQKQPVKPALHEIKAGDSGIAFGTWFVRKKGPAFGDSIIYASKGKLNKITIPENQKTIVVIDSSVVATPDWIEPEKALVSQIRSFILENQENRKPKQKPI